MKVKYNSMNDLVKYILNIESLSVDDRNLSISLAGNEQRKRIYESINYYMESLCNIKANWQNGDGRKFYDIYNRTAEIIDDIVKHDEKILLTKRYKGYIIIYNDGFDEIQKQFKQI